MYKILFVCHGNICRSPMAEFVLKDMVGSIPVVAFAGTLKKFKVQKGQKVLIVGRVTKNDFGVQITAMDICALSLADTSIKDVWLYANEDVEKSKVQRKQLMKLVASQNTGSVQLHFYHKDFSFDNMYVDLNLEMFNELQKVFGEKNCALRKHRSCLTNILETLSTKQLMNSPKA